MTQMQTCLSLFTTSSSLMDNIMTSLKLWELLNFEFLDMWEQIVLRVSDLNGCLKKEHKAFKSQVNVCAF